MKTFDHAYRNVTNNTEILILKIKIILTIINVITNFVTQVITGYIDLVKITKKLNS